MNTFKLEFGLSGVVCTYNALIKWGIIPFFHHSHLVAKVRTGENYKVLAVTITLWFCDSDTAPCFVLKTLNLWINATYNWSIFAFFFPFQKAKQPLNHFFHKPWKYPQHRKKKKHTDRWKCSVKYKMSFIQSKWCVPLNILALRTAGISHYPYIIQPLWKGST